MEGALAGFWSLTTFMLKVLNQAPWSFSPPHSGSMFILQRSVRLTSQANASPVCAQFVWQAAIDCPSAARWGCDRAVVQVNGVHHWDREVENERRGGCGCRWGGGCRWLGSQQRASCGGCFGSTWSGEDLRLELQQLAHEAEVGRDDAAAPAHKLKGFIQTHALPLHQVGKADGCRAGDACLTVDQHSSTGVSYRIWENNVGVRGYHNK